MVDFAQPESIRVNGVNLSFIKAGQGDTVLFVHGTLGDFRTWRLQVDAFSERYRVVTYSRRYHWPNDPPTNQDVYTIADHVADLMALIESLGSERPHVIGTSYGAMTVLTTAAQRPELFRSLVLNEPPLFPWLMRHPEGVRLVEEFTTRAWRPAGEALSRGEIETGVRLFLDGVLGAGAFDRFPEAGRDIAMRNTPAMTAETRMPLHVNYSSSVTPDDVAGIHVPALLLQGEATPRMFVLVQDELVGLLPNAERATIPAASHSAHVQNAPVYNATVLEFLARQ
jgi:non-heme chloroperoxidase